MLSIFNQYPGFQLLSPAVQKILDYIAETESTEFNHVNVVIADDKSVNKLKYEYFSEDVYTDTISFNLNEPDEPVEGEIYLSLDRIKENAALFQISFKTELINIICHSFLHLAGYDDDSPEKKQIMYEKQQACINSLELPYLFRTSKS